MLSDYVRAFGELFSAGLQGLVDVIVDVWNVQRHINQALRIFNTPARSIELLPVAITSIPDQEDAGDLPLTVTPPPRPRKRRHATRPANVSPEIKSRFSQLELD